MRFLNLKTLLAALVVTGACAFAGNTASACDHCTYKTVTVYVPVQQSYRYYVTKYDHCNKPYHVEKIGYKTIQVPVTKRVKVCY